MTKAEKAAAVASVVFGRMAYDLQLPGQYIRNVRLSLPRIGLPG